MSTSSAGGPVRVINLTAHDVVVFGSAGDVTAVFPKTGDVARVGEVTGPARDLPTSDGPATTSTVRYEDIQGLPPPESGVRYVVSRITAAASSRSDVIFPHLEVRDQAGQIVGCHTLGYFTRHHEEGRGSDDQR